MLEKPIKEEQLICKYTSIAIHLNPTDLLSHFIAERRVLHLLVQNDSREVLLHQDFLPAACKRKAFTLVCAMDDLGALVEPKSFLSEKCF